RSNTAGVLAPSPGRPIPNDGHSIASDLATSASDGAARTPRADLVTWGWHWRTATRPPAWGYIGPMGLPGRQHQFYLDGGLAAHALCQHYLEHSQELISTSTHARRTWQERAELSRSRLQHSRRSPLASLA